MTQTDWIGGAARPTFRDIRNQRESKASRKAELCLQLGRLCGKAPPPRAHRQHQPGQALEARTRTRHGDRRQQPVVRNGSDARHQVDAGVLARTGGRP